MNDPEAPKYPDPNQLVDAQTKANKANAVTQQNLNSINQYTPWGSQTYKQVGSWPDGTPKYQVVTALSPEQQQQKRQQDAASSGMNVLALQQLGRLGGTLSSPVDLSKGNIDRYTNTHFTDDFDREWTNSRASLETDLANRGLKIGSTAYSRALSDFEGNKGNARDNLYGNMYDRATNSILTSRNQPINEIISLLSRGAVQQPQFGQTPQTGVEGTDTMGAANNAYQAQYANYQNQVNKNNSTLGGLFGLGSSLLGGWAMSQRDQKKDIKKVGKVGDLPLYTFKYRAKTGMDGGLTRMGMMADEVKRVVPSAVAKGADGIDRVNYARVMGA